MIALVVTIVVLLILAGITISLVFSENGIIAKAREAAERTNQAVINEQAQMNELAEYMENMLNGIGGGSTPEEPTLPSDGTYSETKGVNTPKLTSEMTPIKWDTETNDWVETTGSDPEWYSYTETDKKWANVKVEVDGVESYFVWIPRYAYSITSGYHSSSTGTIEVEFLKGTSNEIGDSEAATNITITNASGAGNWNIHSAFNYGQTVSGLWVAKFEASSVQGNSNSSSGDNVTTKTLQVKPGVASWRYIYIGTAYTNCLNYNKTLNSHMMKNDEWGAVAYLSKSKYGKQTEEVTINSNSSYYTGGGSGNTYVNNGAQSTTGNVYGVYDMSGGAWEYVAAYVDNGNSSLTSYGNSLYKNTDTKTKNVYTKASTDNNTNNYNQNASKYGDAVYETSTSGNGSTSWYSDYSNFSSASTPFFGRGGYCENSTGAGVLAFLNHNGGASSSVSFRPVLVET